MLGYELGPDDGSTVYGTIAGTGTVDINGKPGEVNIKVDATPSRGSVMCYDITSPEAIGTQEFIQWVSRDSLQALLANALPPTNNDAEPEDVPTDIHINFLIQLTCHHLNFNLIGFHFITTNLIINHINKFNFHFII